MNRKKSQSQKSRRREPATKPFAVPYQEAREDTSLPPIRSDAELQDYFLAQLEEIYRTTRDQYIAYLRFCGIHDAEGAFHSAVHSTLRTGCRTLEDVAFLKHRLKCRVLTAMAIHYLRQSRVQDVPDEFWPNLPADDAPAFVDNLSVELAYLFQRLKACDVQVLACFHLEHYSIKQISLLTRRPKNTIKSDLRRSRRKARKILIEFRAKEDAARNRSDTSEG